jgi:hypothetical protein
MKLWALERLDEDLFYDEYVSFMVRAESEYEARKFVANEFHDKIAKLWLDPKFSSCEEVSVEGIKEIVHSYFRHG